MIEAKRWKWEDTATPQPPSQARPLPSSGTHGGIYSEMALRADHNFCLFASSSYHIRDVEKGQASPLYYETQNRYVSSIVHFPPLSRSSTYVPRPAIQPAFRT